MRMRGDAVTTSQEQYNAVAAGLALLTTDEADKIIGVATTEYGMLIRAVEAECGLWFALSSQRHGLRRNKGSQKTMAQAMTVLYQLLHFAYALGIRRGRNAESRT